MMLDIFQAPRPNQILRLKFPHTKMSQPNQYMTLNVKKHDSQIFKVQIFAVDFWKKKTNSLVCNMWKVDTLPTSTSDYFFIIISLSMSLTGLSLEIYFSL
jgi:hypothetical protein